MGNYTLQELPAVANIFFSVNCAGLAEIDHLVFQPHSSQANLTEFFPDANHANATLGPFQLSLGFATSGYWDLLNNSRELNPPVISEHPLVSPTATAFVPGVYTVAVSDEWGQAAVLHFTVKG
jgi:hypothetical protein